MKTKSKLFLILFIIVTLLTSAVFATEPTTEPTGDEPVTTSEDNAIPVDETTEGEAGDGQEQSEEISEEDIVGDDQFLTGDDIEISKLMDGNIFAMGKNVTVSGQIAGDLFVVADTLTINGVVYGNVYAVASEITLNEEVHYLYATCDKLRIEYQGYVFRDANVIASDVYINGIVNRTANIETDKLVLDTEAIMLNLNYKAPSEVVYMEKTDDENTQETTTIPEEVVQGETNNKIKSDTNEEDLKKFVVSYALGITGINTNSETVKEYNNVTIPTVYVYVALAIIIVLAVLLIITLGKNKNNKPSNVEIEKNTAKETKKDNTNKE